MLVIQANIPCIAPQELSVAVNKDQAFSEQPFFGAFKRNEEVLIEVQIKRLFDDMDSDRASLLPTLSFTHTDSLSLSLSARAYMTDEGMRCAHMTDEVMRCAHMADEGMGKEKGIIFF